MAVQEQVKTTVDELLKVLPVKNIMGDPMDMGDKIVITITKVGLAFGTGTGEGKGERGMGGSGGGAGGAVGITPVAVLVIQKDKAGPDSVKVLPLTGPSALGKAIGDVASTVVERMKSRAETKESESPTK
jgi:uncharacterized spore protein YtfJ